MWKYKLFQVKQKTNAAFSVFMHIKHELFIKCITTDKTDKATAGRESVVGSRLMLILKNICCPRNWEAAYWRNLFQQDLSLVTTP